MLGFATRTASFTIKLLSKDVKRSNSKSHTHTHTHTMWSVEWWSDGYPDGVNE